MTQSETPNAKPRHRADKRREGKALVVLATLLALLVCAGGMNYVRNLKADQASETVRPFHGYETDDLLALQAAYEAEVTEYRKRYQSHRAGGQRSGRSAMMDENVAGFERVQEHTTELRELSGDVAEREARIRDIAKELTARAAIGEGWAAHLRRLVRI